MKQLYMFKNSPGFYCKVFIFSIVFPTIAYSQTPPPVIPLWVNGAPGFESLKNEPEEQKDYWVKNINNPSITAYFPPKEKANGTAVVICPGGGHRLLVINAEGTEPALFLNNIGVTAFVLKYRLGRQEKSPYSVEKHPKEDALRAMRLVRSRAAEWNINPDKIGILGFSAGGEVVSSIAYNNDKGNEKAVDPVDRVNGKPNFQMLVYPGPLFIPDSVNFTAPPLFMITANDDECCSGPVVKLLERYRAAKVPVEAHLYTQGGHGFNMGNRSLLSSIKGWPQRMADWMADNIFPKPGQK
ncbi:MAG: alpha/beta hydrolase [Ginsengibacter sp.]